MAKFCSHCGNAVHEKAVVCLKCGCALSDTNTAHTTSSASLTSFVDTISQRINTNGIIWMAIAIVQILLGIFASWFFLFAGILNMVSSIQDLKYSKEFPTYPVGIIDKVKPLTGPILTLAYNLLIGGVIGVIGSIYYFVSIRGYVLENELAFWEIEKQATTRVL